MAGVSPIFNSDKSGHVFSSIRNKLIALRASTAWFQTLQVLQGSSVLAVLAVLTGRVAAFHGASWVTMIRPNL